MRVCIPLFSVAAGVFQFSESTGRVADCGTDTATDDVDDADDVVHLVSKQPTSSSYKLNFATKQSCSFKVALHQSWLKTAAHCQLLSLERFLNCHSPTTPTPTSTQTPPVRIHFYVLKG